MRSINETKNRVIFQEKNGPLPSCCVIRETTQPPPSSVHLVDPPSLKAQSSLRLLLLALSTGAHTPRAMTWPVGFLFTPQQLQGSVKYSSGVRLGNWREDDALDDLRLMDYVEAKERGQLVMTAKREMRAPQIAPRTLSTASSDGVVRNGDLLQLTHLSGALPQRSSTEAEATKPRHSPKRRSLQPRARPHPPPPLPPHPPHTSIPPLLSGAVIAANMGQQLKELDEMGVMHPVTVASDQNP